MARWLRRVVLAAVVSAGMAGGAYFYQREVRGNFHVVVDGEVYRSAQPSPEQLGAWARKYGIKTVVNLRGRSSRPFYEAQRAEAAASDLRMVDIRFSAVRLPTTHSLRKLFDVLETGRRPILLHCLAGADRTGVASAIAAMAVGGETYEQARKQLSLRYLHLGGSDDHIEGLLRRYEHYCRAGGISTAGWPQFRRWVTDVYHPYYYNVRIIAPPALRAEPGRSLSVPLTIINLCDRTIPAADPSKLFTVASFSGSSERDSPEKEFGPRTPLPRADIAPGAAVAVELTVLAPAAEGEYLIHFDVVEEHRTWFARQGSAVPSCRLVVARAGSTGERGSG